MSTVKIADLPVATSVADIAVLPVVQGDITQQATKTTFLTGVTLTNPNLGTPSAGTLTNCTGLPIDAGTFGTLPASRGGTGLTSLGTNVATFLQTPTSANLAAALTDETGTGANVFATSPTLTTPTLTSPTMTTPVLGVATATSINKLAITAPATSATLTVANGKTLTANSSLTLAGVDAKTLTVNNSLTLAGTDAKTLTVSNSLTLAGTDATVMTFPTTSASIARTDAAQTFTGTQTYSGAQVANGLLATGAAAPTIASAATIAPTTQIVFVSGTAAIDTITPPSPISLGGGQITLIPTGLFTTTTAGNIALASTAVVSRALIMTYDVTTTKWYPSY
jgi:hypothetical protein